MKTRRAPVVSERKHPRQDRSTRLVEAILGAAIRVLTRDGAARFTTVRVAEAAGVSVGSLYQYFPNKEAILFRLQANEWRETSALLAAILDDASLAPTDRLRKAIHAFFVSECEEAAFRGALDDAAPLYRDAPAAQEHRAKTRALVDGFLAEAVPSVARDRRALAGELVVTTMAAVGKSVSETKRAGAEVAAWADATADMLGAYLERLATEAPPRPRATGKKVSRRDGGGGGGRTGDRAEGNASRRGEGAPGNRGRNEPGSHGEGAPGNRGREGAPGNRGHNKPGSHGEGGAVRPRARAAKTIRPSKG